MSFAISDGGRSATKPLNEKSSSSCMGGSGDFKIQQAIQVIQRSAAHMRKEASLLETAQMYTPNKQNAQTLAQEARLAAEEARRNLRALSLDVGGSREELALRKLKYQKLNDNLQGSVGDLEQSWTAYQAAEAAHASRRLAAEQDQSSAVMLQPSSSSARDLEGGQLHVQQQQAETVSSAEVEMHAAIAEEYCRDAANLARNVSGMQQALLDIARITESQGEMLDTIETNMNRASDNTENAVEQLQKANESQQRGMKWILRLMCAIVFLIIAMVTYVVHDH